MNNSIIEILNTRKNNDSTIILFKVNGSKYLANVLKEEKNWKKPENGFVGSIYVTSDMGEAVNVKSFLYAENYNILTASAN